MQVKKLIKQFVFNLIDYIYNIDTEARLSIAELQLDPEKSTLYDPIDWISLYKVLKHLPISSNDVFLDVGCGKGRAMLIASKFEFSEVYGVEISEQLCSIAERNLANWKADKNRFFVINNDIESFEIPVSVNVIFMFNPFHGSTFEKFVENLQASIKMKPRLITILYRNPKCHDMLMRIEGIYEIPVIPKKYYGSYKIYSITG